MKIPIQLKNLKFCRIKRGTKKPFEKDWTNKPYSYEEISKFENENYGVLCGYENLAVIDCDEEALQLAVKTLLPETFEVKTPNGHHFYYFIPELKQKLILEADKHIGEVQSYGTQVVGPSSIHPSKKKYEVANDTKIATISADELYLIVSPFIKEIKESEDLAIKEKNYLASSHTIDDLSVADIWGTIGLKHRKGEYFGSHPIHGSEGGVNFWINSLKNVWHCFRCNSGGGALSAIAVKEGLIDCSQSHAGSLRGKKALEALQIAKEKYGLKPQPVVEITKIKEISHFEEEISIIWDKDLQNWEEEEKEWIVEKLIPNKSVCILTGKRGTLKTFISLEMGYSIATGKNFLNKFSTKKGKVVYLDKENGISIMKKRTAMLKKGSNISNEDIKIGFICFSQLKIDKLGDIILLERMIEKEKPTILFVDTYRRGISFDENDAGAVSKLFVDTLRPIVEKYNISIILIHHDRKGTGNPNDEMDEIRGSSDLANYADIILKMERKGNILILKQLKNRNAPEEKPIKIITEFNSDTLIRFKYDGEFEKTSKIGKCIENLTFWIAEKSLTQFSTKDAKDIAFKNGVKESTFKNALIEMINVGIIENVGFGIYKVINQQGGYK